LTVVKLLRVAAHLALAVALAGCALLPATRADRSSDGVPTPTPIPTAIVPIKPTYTVTSGEIVNLLEFSGRISPVVEEELFFRVAGRVRTVFQKRNDFIEAGTIIAELEIDGLERQLEAAQLELERAQIRLQQAERLLDYEKKVAQANVEMAQIRLDAFNSEAAPDRTSIALQQKQVELALLQVEELEHGVDPMLLNEVTRQELTVARLEAEISEARVIAPFSGRLLSLALTPGQSVEAYRPVATIADISSFEVKADLISSQMERLVEGMPADIQLVSRPGVILDGSVRQLPYPYGSGGTGRTVEELDKSTRITIDASATDAGFNLGDLVRINVELERKDSVLFLPPQALRVFDGRRFAVLQDGDVQRRVDVLVGIQTPERVEIREGLEEGQVVVGP
jgi:multidrug efflux pump subunit AcrA (membrane-fusion protein)